jgi:hypothetical protein
VPIPLYFQDKRPYYPTECWLMSSTSAKALYAQSSWPPNSLILNMSHFFNLTPYLHKLSFYSPLSHKFKLTNLPTRGRIMV